MTDGIRAETVRVAGHDGDEIEAYLAQPLAEGAFGAVVVIHHFPGYDEETKEITRRFADHGYLALCPNLYSRQAPGASPEEAAAVVRASGGIPDEQLVGDVDGAARYLTSLSVPHGASSNGKVGTIGYCSGGRQSFLAACSLTLDAAVDCYGAYVVVSPPEGSPLKVGPVSDRAEHLSCPLLGLFGAEDQSPSPEQTVELEAILRAHHKTFEFHTFEGAGHAFFATNRPNYRPEVAALGWAKIWDFFGRYLST